jgi:hypothetical protein
MSYKINSNKKNEVSNLKEKKWKRSEIKKIIL